MSLSNQSITGTPRSPCHTVKGDCSYKGPRPWLPSQSPGRLLNPPIPSTARRVRLAPPSSISAKATSLAKAQPGFYQLLGPSRTPRCSTRSSASLGEPSMETVTESLMVTRMAGGGYCPGDVSASLGCTGGPPLGALSLPDLGFFSLRKLKAG